MAQATPAAGQLSADRSLVWNGAEWRPVLGWRWEPSSWTRPLHALVSLYWLLVAALELATPLLFGGVIRATLTRTYQHDPRIDPSQIDQLVNVAYTVSMYVLVVLAVISLILAALSWFPWTWLFYVDLVLLGYSLVSVVQGLIALTRPTAATAGMAPLTGASLTLSLFGAAVFAAMLYARVKRGVWAARQVPVTG